MGIQAFNANNPEGLPLSAAIRAGDFVFVSGMVGFGDGEEVVPGGVGPETEKIIADLVDVLGEAGIALEHVVKSTVFLTDAADFDAFNAVYAKHFNKRPPARITVVSDLTIDARVEIDFIAYCGD